jgi:pimeloyl-ACP methyl ester carboxylesterase
VKQDNNVEIKFLEIDSKKIEYQVFGKLSNNVPVLILLHEGLGSIAMWRKIPELIHLKTKLNVLVYSRFGYGKSSTIKLPRP